MKRLEGRRRELEGRAERLAGAREALETAGRAPGAGPEPAEGERLAEEALRELGIEVPGDRPAPLRGTERRAQADRGRDLRRKGERGAAARFRPRRFEVAGGWPVLVGRNASENDHLTHRVAHPSDLWFHARGAGGSRERGRQSDGYYSSPSSVWRCNS